jgi:hypothetical protein
MDEATQILHQAWQRATTGPGAINAPTAVMLMARHKACQAVKRQLQAANVKVSYVPVREIVQAANAYLQEHPELFEQAAEIIRNDPSLRKSAELEERRRARKSDVLSGAKRRRR